MEESAKVTVIDYYSLLAQCKSVWCVSPLVARPTNLLVLTAVKKTTAG
jgi:hypothetical protein